MYTHTYIYICIYISYCKCIMITHIDTYWHILTHIDTYWHILTHIDTYWHILTHIDTYWHILTHIDTLLLFRWWWWWWWWWWWFPLDFHFCFRIFGNLWTPRPAPGESLGTLWEPSTWYLGNVAFFFQDIGDLPSMYGNWNKDMMINHDFSPSDSRQTHIFLMEKPIENCDSARDSKRNQPWDYHFWFATGWYGISHL